MMGRLSDSYNANYAHRQVFNNDEENELEEHLITSAKMCYGLSPRNKPTTPLAYQLALKNGKTFQIRGLEIRKQEKTG